MNSGFNVRNVFSTITYIEKDYYVDNYRQSGSDHANWLKTSHLSAFSCLWLLFSLEILEFNLGF